MHWIHRVEIAKTNCLVVVGINTGCRTLKRTVVSWEGQIGEVRTLGDVRWRQAELFVEIRPEAHRFHACDFSRCWTPTRLFEETDRVGFSGWSSIRVWN